MPSNLEFALLTRVIQDQDFQTLEKARINESFFFAPESREVFKYLRDTFHGPNTFGSIPSFQMIQMRFPQFFFAPAHDSVPVLAYELKKERLAYEIENVSEELKQLSRADPLQALAKMRSKSSDLGFMDDTSEDLSMAAAYQELQERYNLVSESRGIIGIPFPWEILTTETQGMQPGQFFILYGRPKSMKSWLAVCIAVFAYLFARRRVLYVTREMPAIQLAGRAAATIARLDYDAFRKGRLTPENKARFFEILRDLQEDEQAAGVNGNHQPFLIFTADKSAKGGGAAGGGVSWIQSKIRDLKPDLVIVDGMYLLKDDRSNQRTVDWKAIAHISQDLKLTSQDFNIPILGVTQATRTSDKAKGEDLTEMAYSDAFGQDADGVLRVTKMKRVEQVTKKKITELLVSMPGFREGSLEGFVLNAMPAYNFDYVRTVVNLNDEVVDYAEEEQPKRETGYDKPGGATGIRRSAVQSPRPPITR
jgi:hypothetical protein